MGNVAQLITAVTKPQHSFSYFNGSLAQSGNGTLLSGTTGLTQRIMPYKGSVYAISGAISAALTAGTLQLQPSINGTVQPFNVHNEAAGQIGLYGSQAARITQFAAGDTLQVVYNAAALDAAGVALEVDVYVLFEGVNL